MRLTWNGMNVKWNEGSNWIHFHKIRLNANNLKWNKQEWNETK